MDFDDTPEEAAFRRSYTHYGVTEFHDLLNPDLHDAVDTLVDEHADLYNQYRTAFV